MPLRRAENLHNGVVRSRNEGPAIPIAGRVLPLHPNLTGFKISRAQVIRDRPLLRHLDSHVKSRVFGKRLRARRSLRIGCGIERHLEAFTVFSLEDQFANLGKNISNLGSLERLSYPWLHQPLVMEDDMFREWVAINLHVHPAVPRKQAVCRPVSGQDAAHPTRGYGVAPDSLR